MKPRLPPILLASASPRRRSLLRELGVRFTVVRAVRVPEVHSEHLTARELSLVNARRKARAVAARFPGHLVIGADTLVSLGTRLFGKPGSLREARRMLETLSGRTHLVVTGVCLMRLRPYRCRQFAAVTAVSFRKLNRAAINDYLAAVNPLDKAGAYAIQEHGTQLVRSLAGSYSNVIGLPLDPLWRVLAAWNAPGRLLRSRARPRASPSPSSKTLIDS
ncbi:MAG TPA: Maf family protein [Verrucomicrobiota bacterium]|nr:Maf family protein [Verrucomicrobiota bacterium]HNU49331.1 Maf family protein [Verrucomicrobiota bacterium]